jgi:hypothetical protein
MICFRFYTTDVREEANVAANLEELQRLGERPKKIYVPECLPKVWEKGFWEGRHGLESVQERKIKKKFLKV